MVAIIGGKCTDIDVFAHATVAEYGTIHNDVNATMAEVFARGPVAALINANPMHDYRGGVFSDDSFERRVNHVVSIVGWGIQGGKRHWIIRNSWGK